MMGEKPAVASVIYTRVPSLVLVPLTQDHASALHQLVQENSSHLTAHGDYAELVARPLETLADELRGSAEQDLRFGIFLNQTLIGRIDLVTVAPPRYGLGYWLEKCSTGKGYATASIQALLEFARDDLGASDIFAGVTHGNLRSAAVLERTGFVAVKTFEKYTRFHRELSAK